MIRLEQNQYPVIVMVTVVPEGILLGNIVTW